MNNRKLPMNPKTVRRYRIGYLAPTVALLLLLIAVCLPVLQYTTAAGVTNQSLSTLRLLRNSWNEVREYLFGTSEQLSVTLTFSKTVLITLIIGIVCFLLGAAASVFYTVGALRYLSNPEDTGTARILWITLFPNRAVACLWFLLLLPLLAFPRLLVGIYAFMLHSAVTLKFSPAEPLWLFLLFFIILCVLSVYEASQERSVRFSPFVSNQHGWQKPLDSASENPTADEDAEEDEQTRKAREEQLLQIRRLLSQKEDRSDSDT